MSEGQILVNDSGSNQEEGAKEKNNTGRSENEEKSQK